MNTRASVLDTAFTAIDFETTGLHAGLDRIVELGAVRFRGDVIEAEIEQLVNPECDISEDAAGVSGIDSEMIRDKPVIAEVLPDFMAVCEGSVLVAHNASFDMGFLRAALHETGLPEVNNRVIDTQLLAQRAFPRQRSYSLQALIEMLEIPPNNAHRAKDDAYMCMKLFLACADQLSFMGEVTLEEVLT
ncbi:MAG: PolC-type DNA polymerase III [Spirochaetales bacterium]